MSRIARIFSLLVLVIALSACASTSEVMKKMTTQSVDPGTSVTMRGEPFRLLGEPLKVGKPLPSVELIDAMTMKPVDLSKERGSILLLSVVTSLGHARLRGTDPLPGRAGWQAARIRQADRHQP